MNYKDLFKVLAYFVIGFVTDIYARAINDWNSWIVIILGLVLCFLVYKIKIASK